MEYVKNTSGVVDFLAVLNPTALTEEEVEEILTDIEAQKTKVTQKHKFKWAIKSKLPTEYLSILLVQ